MVKKTGLMLGFSWYVYLKSLMCKTIFVLRTHLQTQHLNQKCRNVKGWETVNVEKGIARKARCTLMISLYVTMIGMILIHKWSAEGWALWMVDMNLTLGLWIWKSKVA